LVAALFISTWGLFTSPEESDMAQLDRAAREKGPA